LKKTPEKGRARFLIIETLKNSGILQPNEVALNSITIANQLIKRVILSATSKLQSTR